MRSLTTRDWKRMLTNITGSVEQELLLRNEIRLPKTVFFAISSKGDCG